jgi:hypothetical protein
VILRRRGRWLIIATLSCAIAAVVLLANCLQEEDGQEAETSSGESLPELAAEAPDRLNALESYRYDSSLAFEIPSAGDELGATDGSVVAEGEAVPPDAIHHVATTTLGDVSADEELVRLPEGNFIKRQDGYTEGLGELNTFIVSAPSLWSEIAGIAQLLPEDATTGEDIVDGRAAIRYTVEEVRLLWVKDYVLRLFGAVESAAVLPDFYRMEFWFSQDSGTPLKVTAEGEGIDPQGGTVRFLLDSTISDIGQQFTIELE